jgi:hypothetical protein
MMAAAVTYSGQCVQVAAITGNENGFKIPEPPSCRRVRVVLR